MTNPKLLTGEKVLMSSNKDIIVLSNYRVRLTQTTKGILNYVSVALDCVASCELVTKSKPILLTIAAVCVLIGIIQNEDELRYGLLITAVVLVVIYYFTRSAVIAISSNGGGKIIAPVKGMGRESIFEFLDAVEEARLKFIGKIEQ